MRRLLFLTVTLVAALVTAVAFAQSPTAQDRANASRLCRAQRAAMGTTAFNQLYGTNANRSNAFGKCVSKLAQAQQQNRQNAAQACRGEQNDPNFAATHGGKTFAQFYGAAKGNGKNAFGRCVSSKAQTASDEQQTTTLNAAQQCKAQRKAMGDKAFAALYGTNGNKRNAFGKCVSKLAKTEGQNRQSAAQACRAEQSDPNFAAGHSGKTFAQYYGTNADLSNAFGNCVSQKAKTLSNDQQQATINAARACQAERTAIGESAFRKKYGTNANRSDAFGKCVSSKVGTH
jgi:hypothetical protein